VLIIDNQAYSATEDDGSNTASQENDARWITTAAAARLLGVSPRTVRDYIKKDLLEARMEGNSTNHKWSVSMDSINELRTQRPIAAESAEDFHKSSAENIAEGITEAIRKIALRLAEESAQAAELRVRLELAERAEFTLRENLERERERTERAQQYAERLAVDLKESIEHTQRLAEQYERTRRQSQEQAQQLHEAIEAGQSRGFFSRLFWK